MTDKMIMRLRTPQDWEDLKKQVEAGAEAVVFKYSPTCSISKSVERGFETWNDSLPPTGGPIVVKVNVVDSRPLSQQIAADTGIPHESPQALWLKAGGVKWQASHYGITADALMAQSERRK